MDLPFAVPDPAPIQPTVLLQKDNALAASSTLESNSGPTLQRTSAHTHTMLSQPNGGILYNNLIPGHYRYGAKPPEPPPGPLSVESSHSYTNVQNRQSQSLINRQVLHVSEPDEEDDDLFVIALEEDDDDDEKMYRPFRYSASNGSVHMKSDRSVSSASTNSKKSKGRARGMRHVETKPVDLLAVLLGGSAHDGSTVDRSADHDTMSVLIEEATTLSRKARSMTTALAAKNDTQSTEKKENDLYVETANAHTEAALAFRKVYRSLLGVDDDSFSLNVQKSSGMSQSEELAKSMLILANGHVRMAASLGDMGVKWNMGKADSFFVCNKAQPASKAAARCEVTQTAPNNESKQIRHHERIRLAVRGALDTANHEADITNSTFLARSTFLNTKPAASKSKVEKVGSAHTYKENPVDDL